MRELKLIVTCWLLLSSLCLTDSAGQKGVRYPQNAGEVIAVVDSFSQVDFSVKDAIKRFDAANPAKDYHKDGSVLLTLSQSDQRIIKRAVLDIFAGKPDRVNIEYIKPVSISYGTLKEKYGSPRYLSPPVAKCAPRAVNCPPRFVGYSFSFMPDEASITSGKRLGVAVDLAMQWSKEVPRHTDKDVLTVKEIRFRRVWRDK